MSLDILILDDAARGRLRLLRVIAEQYPISLDEMMRRSRSNESADDHPNPMTQVGNYTVCLTIEEHPGARCRHLSVASVRDGRAPMPTVIELFMLELGFVNKLGLTQDSPDAPIKGSANLPTWTERTPDGRLAINVLEPLDGRVHRLQSRLN